jgi:hypothetical protein
LFVEITHGHAVLRELDDLRSLSVRHSATVTHDDVANALARDGLGALDGDGHAWLDIDALLNCDAAPGPRWRQDFTAVIAYAESRGWVRDGRVRAHLEVSGT